MESSFWTELLLTGNPGKEAFSSSKGTGAISKQTTAQCFQQEHVQEKEKVGWAEGIVQIKRTE